MRYRIFQDKRLCGPFEPAELLGVPGFSAETLVSAEGTAGRDMGDWRRAGAVAELAELLRAAPKPRGGAAARTEHGAFSPDLAARMRVLEERLAGVSALKENLDKAVAAESGLEAFVRRQSQAVEELSQAVAAVRKQLGEKEGEPGRRLGEPAGGGSYPPELASILRALRERLASFESIKERLDQKASSGPDLEASVRQQSLVIEGLKREIEDLKSRNRAEEPLPAPAPGPASPASLFETPLVETAPPPASAAVLEIPAFSPNSGWARPEPGVVHKPESKTVLIVDDDESVLNLLEIFIRRDGFSIDLARTGEEALEKIANGPDALVLDLMLPGASSGFEVLRQLRQRKPPIPPVIVITAYGNSKEVDEVKRDPNVALFLPKPINQAKLLGGLHGILGTRPSGAAKKPALTDPVK